LTAKNNGGDDFMKKNTDLRKKIFAGAVYISALLAGCGLFKGCNSVTQNVVQELDTQSSTDEIEQYGVAFLEKETFDSAHVSKELIVEAIASPSNSIQEHGSEVLEEHTHSNGEWVSIDDEIEGSYCTNDGELVLTRAHQYESTNRKVSSNGNGTHTILSVDTCVNCNHTKTNVLENVEMRTMLSGYSKKKRRKKEVKGKVMKKGESEKSKKIKRGKIMLT